MLFFSFSEIWSSSLLPVALPLEKKLTLLPPPSLQSPGEVSAAPSEGTSKETNSKRAKKDDEKRDTGNSPYDNDEIAVLQGMIDFKKDMGNSPYDDTNAYYHYIKKSISIEVSTSSWISLGV
ncbi:hypothetical protein DY000_02036350 [Brassica cretica]|uniref:Glabrous enhancer-binding protein-like DBD domain-containing protein n=1 Tax=Brassica cretica TaxID=69181 RepID=A0ABQ7BQR5_BRACR|nr:hypothetical protein DY000_02036350 [Brassica cretica]